jgi:hypothetical protein
MKLASKLAIASVALAALFTASAQEHVMRLSVPFKFHAGDTVLPAGDYCVRSNHADRRVAIIAADGSNGIFLPVRSSVVPATVDRGSLVFNVYGTAAFLTAVKNPGLSDGFEIHTSRAEKEMARLKTPREVAVVFQRGH